MTPRLLVLTTGYRFKIESIGGWKGALCGVGNGMSVLICEHREFDVLFRWGHPMDTWMWGSET